MSRRELDSGVHVGWRERQELSRHDAKRKEHGETEREVERVCGREGEGSERRMESERSDLKNEEWE